MSEKRESSESGGQVGLNKRLRATKSSEAEFAAAEGVVGEDFHCINPTKKEVNDELAAKRVDPRQLSVASVEFMAVRQFNEELTEEQREQSTLARFSAYFYLRNGDIKRAVEELVSRDRIKNKRWTILQCWEPLPDPDDRKKAKGGHYILAVIDNLNKKIYILDSMERKGLSSGLGDRVNKLVKDVFGRTFEKVQVKCTQQTNGYDCGVYMAKFVSYFFRWLWDNTATCFSSASVENPSVRQQLLIDFSQQYSNKCPADIQQKLIENLGDAEAEMTSSEWTCCIL